MKGGPAFDREGRVEMELLTRLQKEIEEIIRAGDYDYPISLVKPGEEIIGDLVQPETRAVYTLMQRRMRYYDSLTAYVTPEVCAERERIKGDWMLYRDLFWIGIRSEIPAIWSLEANVGVRIGWRVIARAEPVRLVDGEAYSAPGLL